MNEISVGAVGAALIAGLVSLIGLIISKEQKTSEFRQAWIDALRSEMTTYLSSFNAIADGLQVAYENHGEKVKALSPLYAKFNEAGFAIKLRLNPNEGRSKAVIKSMILFETLATSEASMISANIRPIEIEFLRAAKEQLKYEWKRVKSGERTFFATKVISGLVIATMLAAFWYAPFRRYEKGRVVGDEISVSRDKGHTQIGPQSNANPSLHK